MTCAHLSLAEPRSPVAIPKRADQGAQDPRRQVGWLYGLHFLNDGLQAALLALLSVIALAVGLSELQVGVVSAVHFLVVAVLSVPASQLSRVLPGKPLLFAAMALCAGCFAVAAGTDGFGFALAVYSAAGLGFGIFHPLAFSLIADASPPQGASGSMGWFTAVGDLGRAATVWAVMLLVSLLGWRPVFVAVGAPVALGCLLLCTRPGQRRESLAIRSTEELRCGQRYSAMKQPWFWLLCAIGFLDGLANSGLYVFLPFLLLAKGCDQSQVAVLVCLYFAAGLSGRIVVGWLGDRWGPVASLLLCQLAIGLVIAGLSVSRQLVWLSCGVALLGVFSRSSLPIILSITAERLPPAARQWGFGINQAVLGLAAVLSPLWLGSVSNGVGTTAAFAGAGVLCALNVVAVCTQCGRLDVNAGPQLGPGKEEG
jgi:predicted MFS family arabinose efflux permease